MKTKIKILSLPILFIGFFSMGFVLFGNFFTFNKKNDLYSENKNCIVEENLSIDEQNLLNSYNNLESNNNPYIESGDFNILQETVTSNSVRFSLTVHNIENNNFDPYSTFFIETLVKNEDDRAIISKAKYIETVQREETNQYIYEIDNLSPNNNYEVTAIMYSGLAVGSSTAEVDKRITIGDEIEAEASFNTYAIPYIEEDGFQVDEDSIDKNSFKFTLEVNNWEANYKKDLEVVLRKDNQFETHSAKLSKRDDNNYTYKVKGLKEDSTYSIYSIKNPGFAISPEEEIIEDELVLAPYFGSVELTIHTKNVIDAYIIVIIILVILALIGAIVTYIYFRRKRRYRLMRKTLRGDQ